MACNVSTYNLGIRNLILGQDRYQKHCVFTKADVASSLQNKYFVLHAPVTNAKHYVWFNVATAGVDPAVPNATGHEVAIAANASATAVAAALEPVLEAISFVSSTQSGNEVEMEYTTYGYAYEIRDGFGTNATGFTFETPVFGSVAADLGATNGDITLTIEQDLIDIVNPQTGSFVVDKVRRGVTATCSFELKDSSNGKVRQVINQYGSTFVSDDGDSAVVAGFGTSNLFKSVSNVVDKLVLRPSKLAASSDPSEDITFHKAFLQLGELTFSGEDVFVLPVEVTVLLDESKKAQVNYISYGNAAKA
jgi:hypothetical protein